MVVSLMSHFTTERRLQYENVIFYLEILQSMIIIIKILIIRVVSCIWYSIFIPEVFWCCIDVTAVYWKGAVGEFPYCSVYK